MRAGWGRRRLGRMRAWRAWGAIPATIVVMVAPAVMAQSCGPEPVTARSENSRFEWTAKAKARANWRVRVRGTAGLGPDFANWARAANPEERCLSGPAGVVCILTGTPCKG